jgi:hypothetical protein
MSLWRNLLPGSTLQVVVNWINSVLIPRLIGIDSSITLLSGGGGDAPAGTRAAVQTEFDSLATSTELGSWTDLVTQEITADGDMFVTVHGHAALYGIDTSESAAIRIAVSGDATGVVSPWVYFSLTGATIIESTLVPLDVMAQFSLADGGTATMKLQGNCGTAATWWATGNGGGNIYTYLYCVQTPV